MTSMADPQAALDRALDEENLLLVYQPIHDARTGRLVAAEALLRQRRESGEIREAGIITEAAEDGSQADLFRLDSWLVRTAYRDASRWQHSIAPDVRLNVNLSPREFQEGDLVARLTAIVGECNIELRKVNIEITETSDIEHPKETMHMLDALKDLGLCLWLDDFGTGHSSLTHLQHFPLDGLKVAGEFVGPSPHDFRCHAITKHIVALAHDLGLEVIAEGVETEEQLAFVRELECEAIQGFLFSRPMPLADFLKLLESGNTDRAAAPDPRAPSA
jgi:EAL domain-containing protein (putative c-di-GMP-specific phosphodiesterase class I)